MVKPKETLPKGTKENTPIVEEANDQVTTDLEAAAQAQAEAAEAIRIEKEAAELAAKEKAEKEAKEAKEAAELAAKEKAEKEAKEAKEAADKEAKEAADKESAEKSAAAAKKAASVKSAKESDFCEPDADNPEIMRTLKTYPEKEFVYINKYGGTFESPEHISEELKPLTKKYKNPFYKK